MFIALKHPYRLPWRSSAVQTYPPPNKHPHNCHSNPSPRSRFSSPVVFHTFCLYTFSVTVYLFKRAESRRFSRSPRWNASRSSSKEASDTSASAALRVAEGGGSALCPVQLSPSVSLPLLFNTSCRRTSGEAVPADTWLHKQWAPVRVILHRHVRTACREKKKAGVCMFYQH